MSKLRCIEVGDGFGNYFTLNKEYKCEPYQFLVYDNFSGTNQSSSWFYDEDDLCVLLNGGHGCQLVARFEVVE